METHLLRGPKSQNSIAFRLDGSLGQVETLRSIFQELDRGKTNELSIEACDCFRKKNRTPLGLIRGKKGIYGKTQRKPQPPPQKKKNEKWKKMASLNTFGWFWPQHGTKHLKCKMMVKQNSDKRIFFKLEISAEFYQSPSFEEQTI